MVVGSPELKALYSQWASLTLCDGWLYRCWESPSGREMFCSYWASWTYGAEHFGVTKSLNQLRGRFYWPNCRVDTELFVHICDICTTQKGPTQRSHTPLQVFMVGMPQGHVGVDVLCPFLWSEHGNRYVLVAMDYFTKWPKAYTVSDQSTATTAPVFVEEMFCHFGVLEELNINQGCNFKAEVFTTIGASLEVKKTCTTLLHPQSDRLVEHFNQTLATQLAVLTSRRQRDWDEHLPWSFGHNERRYKNPHSSALQRSCPGTSSAHRWTLCLGAPPEPKLPFKPGMDYFCQLHERLRHAHRLKGCIG